ncbi:MAG: hypothetical protein ACE5FA_13085 [Dehalococcoidia bacterium]
MRRLVAAGLRIAALLCQSRARPPLPYLDRVELDFPELVIVGGHIGYPWGPERIALATKYPNVFIYESASSVRRQPRELVVCLRGHGRRKALLGSNPRPDRCHEQCSRRLAAIVSARSNDHQPPR